MAMNDPFMVYGFVMNSSGYVSGATVDIVDNSLYEGYERVITDDSGYYQINIQYIATNGNVIKVSATHPGGGISEEFVLDESTLFERRDLLVRDNQSTDVNNVSVNISGQ